MKELSEFFKDWQIDKKQIC